MLQKIQTHSFGLSTYEQGNPFAEKLALVLPGKLDSKDYEHIKAHTDALAAIGYYAVSFDPPGTWESDGDITLYTLTNYCRAVEELIQYFGKSETVLAGHSMGGFVAMYVGCDNQCVSRVASIFSRPAFTPDYLREYPDTVWQSTGSKRVRRTLPKGTGYTEFLLPYSFMEDQLPYSLFEKVAQSMKPKLFFCAEDDSIVDPDFVRRAYDIAHEPKQLITLETDHEYRKNPEIIRSISEALCTFFLREF